MKFSITSRTLMLCMTLLLVTACAEEEESSERVSTRVDSMAQQNSIPTPTPTPTQADALDVCALATTLPQSLETLPGSASRILAAPDSCFLRLVDSLGALARREVSPAMLVAVDSLYSVSDGYAGEAVASILPAIFRREPEATLGYLVVIPRERSLSLGNALVESLRQDRATAADTTAALAGDRALFERALRAGHIAPADRPFVDSLMNDALRDD